jgi:carboxyl-terminal processing protease
MKEFSLQLCFVLVLCGSFIFTNVSSYDNEDSLSDNAKGLSDSKLYDAQKDIMLWLPTYSEVLSIVEKKAFRRVDFDKFVQDSLKSAVSKVDAHSSFFSNDEYKSTLESTAGEFSGIGVSIIGKAPDDDSLMIIEVLPGSPAEKVGIKKGDRIIKVGKDNLKNMTTDQVINKLKGKVGSKISIKIVRKKKPMSFMVTRDIIKDQISLCFFFKNQNVYYFSLKQFTENAAKQMSGLLEKANQGKCKGIVLDLRGNPGGTLDSAIETAGLFLPKGAPVVHTRDRNGKIVAKYFTNSEPVLKSDVPIFILINNFTASASEILAGCLRFHSEQSYLNGGWKGKKLMVFLLGMTTFGKGSVQELIPVKNGCALKLTTMLYFLPDGSSLQAQGISPDFTVKPKYVPADEMEWIKEFYGKENSLKNYITVKEVSENLGLPVDEAIKKEEEAKKKEARENSSLLDLSGGTQEFDDADVTSDDDSEADDADANKKDEKSWSERQKEALAADSQVLASVNMINLLNWFKKGRKKKASLIRADAVRLLNKNYLTDENAVIEKVES